MQRVMPLLLYGIVTIIVALLSILLPETKKRKLLEQVEDAEHEENLETERWVYINVYGQLLIWPHRMMNGFNVTPVYYHFYLNDRRGGSVD